MKLNLDFYHEAQSSGISQEEIKVIELDKNTNNFDEALNQDNSINTYIHLSGVKENLLNWYDFKEGSSGLEIGCGFGELVGILSQKLGKFVTIESSLEKAKYVENKYNNEDFELIVGELENIKIDEKFDYIIITDYLEKYDFIETLSLAKQYLKENGIFLIAINNRFGMRNWKGKDNYLSLLGRFNNNYGYSKNRLNSMIKQLGFINHRFYYIFPEYKAPNLIYTDEHKVTLEDISRNLELNNENDFNNFSENEVLNEILKEEPDNINLFVNSFLIEISNSTISNDVKYITFTNYRKDSKEIQTIICKDKVIKKSVTKEGNSHIKEILENQKYFPKENCKLLDRQGKDNSIESDFVYEKRLDEVIEQSKNVKEEFDKYKNIIFQNIVSYESIKKEELLEPLKQLNENQLKNLNFIENAFVDMIPKNCFVIDGVNSFFDQEWMIKWIPAEFILFRAIRYTIGIDQNDLYNYYKLNEFLECFEKLDNYFQDIILDNNKFKIFLRANNTTRYQVEVLQNEVGMQGDSLRRKDLEINRQAELVSNYIKQTEEHVKQIEEYVRQGQEYIKTIENLNAVVADRDNQLAIIANSLSWKITKPLRALSSLIRKIFKK